jgi:uncharacterized membrane protein
MKLKRNKQVFYILFGVIVLVTFLLRIWRIDSLSLWRDEAFTVLLAQKDISKFAQIGLQDTSSFLLNTFLFFWTRLFGSSEFSVRFPSLLFSIGTFGFLYSIVKRNYKKIDQLLILALFSVNMISILYAQEARVYSLLMFLILGSYYFLTNLLKKADTKSIVFFIIFTSLAFYAHYLSAFFIAAEVIYVFIRLLNEYKGEKIIEIIRTPKVKMLMYSFFGTLVIIAPWIIMLFIQMKKVESGFWVTFDAWDTLNETLTGFATGIRLFTQKPFSLFDAVLNITSLLFLVVGTVYTALKKGSNKYYFFFWIPFILIYLTSFFKPLLYIRYVSFLTPFFILTMYDGIKVVFRKVSFRAVVCLIIVLLSFRVYASYLNTEGVKANYKELVNFISKEAQTNDTVTHVNALSFLSYEYYCNNTWDNSSIDCIKSTIFDPHDETPFYVGKSLMEGNDFTRDFEEFTNYDRLWIIELSQISNREEFEKNFILEEEKVFEGNLYLQLWKK